MNFNQFTEYNSVKLGRGGATSLVPADFNKDNLLDFLVTFPNGKLFFKDLMCLIFHLNKTLVDESVSLGAQNATVLFF